MATTRMAFTTTSYGSGEPVTLAELRAQTNVDDAADDAMLLGYLIAARQAAEAFIGRPILPTVMAGTAEEWPVSAGFLLDAPVISVDSVNYTAANGTVTTWTAGASGYLVRDAAGGAKKLRSAKNVAWPTLGDDPVITITITAGWTVDLLPESVRTAILQMAAHWYAVREVVNIGSTAAMVPETGKELLRPYRWRLIG